MGIIDYSIIIVYLLILIGIGIYLQKELPEVRKAFFLEIKICLGGH